VFSKYQQKAAVTIAVLCSASLAVSGMIPDGQHWLIWPVGGTALLLLIVLALRPMPPRRGAVCFTAIAINGVVFLTGSKLSLPASLPVWAWMILAFGMATVGLLEDADAVQSTPKNRL
jgi:hypothetical protein